jgi:hypothetical protein
VICYGELRFTQRAVVLLALKRDPACSILNGYSARKGAVLVLELCYKVKGDRENRICEGTDCLNTTLSSGITSLQLMVVCKMCELGEQ